MEKLLPGVLAILLLASIGCGPPFPRDLLEQVDPKLVYADLQKDPDRYRGRLVMVGGIIVASRNLQEGTEFEVLQKPLAGNGRPEETDVTGGRFLVLSSKFHDVAVFHRGRTLTVIGEVTGHRVQPLGEVAYRYPLVRSREVHLWSPSSGPRFSIGIGVYKGF